MSKEYMNFYTFTLPIGVSTSIFIFMKRNILLLVFMVVTVLTNSLSAQQSAKKKISGS